jgi:uncharacterized protein
MANIQAGSDGAANEEMTAQRLNVVDWMAMILLIVGGLNGALVGWFDIDIVARILGAMLSASRGVYVLVGVAALYSIYLCVRRLPAKP